MGNFKVFKVLIVLVIISSLTSTVTAQHSCQFYAQNPNEIQLSTGQVIEREVEVVYTNSGSSKWERTAGVSNLNYIELRSVDTSGRISLESPLYHTDWINRIRVGSFIIAQNGVSPGERARFVFKVKVDARRFGVGVHDVFFRPYHAQGGYIPNWGSCHFRIIVTAVTTTTPSVPDPSLNQVPNVTLNSFSPFGPYTEGQVIRFSGSADNNPLEYRWESNGSFLSSQATFSQGLTQGSHLVSFKARNKNGWSNKVSQTLNVFAKPADPPQANLQATITGVVLQRTRVNPISQQGAWVENYDLVKLGPITLKRYQILNLMGSANGNVAKYEWSLASNTILIQLGVGSSITTTPDQIPLGDVTLRLRVQNISGQWSAYALYPIKVEYWPKLYLPVNGSWKRNGSDYNTDYHVGKDRGGQDWNHPTPGRTDFGLEILASLAGKVTVESSVVTGNTVYVEYEDTVFQQRFRSRDLHLTSVFVKTGDLVKQGQIIGLCGNTGTTSTGSHLHHVIQKWNGTAWESTIPEPVWISPTQVKQVIAYNETVYSTVKLDDTGFIVLHEERVVGGYLDDEGWGNKKSWCLTTANMQAPTANCEWETVIPTSGWWKLLAHNPSGFTQKVAGVVSHNSTTKAMFELIRPGQLGIQTFPVDQAGSQKGALIPVTEFHAQKGDRIVVRQHNATGEPNKEMAFDELVLKLDRKDDSGGYDVPSDPATSVNPGGQDSMVVVDKGSVNSPPVYSGGSGGGGCSISLVAMSATRTIISALFLIGCLLFLIRWRLR